MAGQGLFSLESVRYEVACDVIGGIIAHYSEALALERAKPEPDAAEIERILGEKRALYAVRDGIDPRDADAVEAVIQKYAPIARHLYYGYSA